MSKKDIDKGHIWIIVFVVFPVVIFMNIGEYFSNDNGTKILYGGLFGGIGGLVGFGLNQIVKDKSTLIKGVTLGAFIIFSSLAIRLIHFNYSNTKLIPTEETEFVTCPVCGYKTLTKNNKLCGECLVELTESEMKEEKYSSIEEFIQEEQIVFFSPDSLVDDIDFYNPKISEEGFKKDSNWKPLTTKASVLKFNKKYVEYIKENPIDLTIILDSIKK